MRTTPGGESSTGRTLQPPNRTLTSDGHAFVQGGDLLAAFALARSIGASGRPFPTVSPRSTMGDDTRAGLMVCRPPRSCILELFSLHQAGGM